MRTSRRQRAAIARDVFWSLFVTAFLRGALALSSGALTVLLVALAASAEASAASSVPLPPDTQITAPAKDIALEIGGFSGKWVGIWDDTLEHVLVVEQINPPNAVVIYASGEAPS